MKVKRQDGKLRWVKRRSVASGATTRSQARNEIRTPLVREQSGGTLSGEHAKGGEWCLAVMFRTASVWLSHGRVVDFGWG